MWELFERLGVDFRGIWTHWGAFGHILEEFGVVRVLRVDISIPFRSTWLRLGRHLYHPGPERNLAVGNLDIVILEAALK